MAASDLGTPRRSAASTKQVITATSNRTFSGSRPSASTKRLAAVAEAAEDTEIINLNESGPQNRTGSEEDGGKRQKEETAKSENGEPGYQRTKTALTTLYSQGLAIGPEVRETAEDLGERGKGRRRKTAKRRNSKK
jgi:hypothetical protein